MSRIWKFPCGFCGRPVKKNEAGVFCDVCCLWNHCRCYSISANEYRALQCTEVGWCCPSCERQALPFADCSLNPSAASTTSRSFEDQPSPTNPLDAVASCLSNSVCSTWSQSSLLGQHPNKPSLSSISLLFSNCRSLVCQMDELQVLVAIDSPPTIIALAETWLDNTILPCELSLPSYSLYRRDRDRHGGGVAIYIHNSLPVCSVTSHPTEEMLSVAIDTTSGCLLVCAIYRPPGHDKGLEDLECSLANLKSSRYRHVLVVGDFNIDTSSPSSCDTLNLVSTLSSFGLCHLPTDHTRITSSTASTIDHLFANDPALIDQLRVVPGLGTSDHCSLFCSLVIKKSRTQSIKRKIWLYQEANFSDLNIALENSLPPEVVLIGGDVNSTWPLFETAFWDSIKKFIPSKIVRLKDSNPPWYTGEVWLALRK